MVSCGNPYEGKILTSKNEKLKYSYGSWKIPKGSNSYTLKNTSVDKVKTYNIKVVRERYTLRPKTRAVKNSPERSEYFKKETLFPGEEKHLTHSIFFIGENEHDGDIDELISMGAVGICPP